MRSFADDLLVIAWSLLFNLDTFKNKLSSSDQVNYQKNFDGAEHDILF